MEPKVVTAAIITKQNNILLMRRAPDEDLAGKWEFPGGKLEIGETPQICLQRELKEELGIDVEIGQHICDNPYNYQSGSIILKAYFVYWHFGEIHLRVHDKLKWVNNTELLSYDLAPADIEIAKTVQRIMSYV